MKDYLLILGCKRGSLCFLAVILEEGGEVSFPKILIYQGSNKTVFCNADIFPFRNPCNIDIKYFKADHFI